MWDLIKLEFRKNKMSREILGFGIVNMAIFLATNFVITKGKLIIKIANGINVEKVIYWISVIFIIYSGILFAELFNEEFEDNTIKTTYMFPQGRKNIIISKVLAALGFAFASMIGSYIVQGTLTIMTKAIFNINNKDVSIYKFIENIPFFVDVIILSLIAVFIIIIIALVIKSVTFNVFSSIFIGATIAPDVMKINKLYAMLPIGLLASIILMIVFLKILEIEANRDI
ncbi:ABC transporter permease [Clostridium sp. MSJ-11]|uniref:ABC transporter permease n=1 Tax=Clostridium mobile TaxID=2841512 RepID=A0ABS6EH16_9CLOT|nr:ABC transporter permease [Clostridium mobile]MBU5484310.1 ABC transporter permease [Clostridium mobile]